MAYNIDKPDAIRAARYDLSNADAILALNPYGTTGKTLWVDSVYGSDSTGTRQRKDKPFLTLNAAKVAAQSGDTIVVLPGTYNEKNLLKDGVNWHFINGAIVSYVGSTTGGIFDDGPNGANGDITSKITGYGTFKITNNATSSDVVCVTQPDSEVYIEATNIENLSTYGSGATAIKSESSSTLNVKAEKISSIKGTITCNNSEFLNISTDLLEVVDYGTAILCQGSFSNVTLNCNKIVGSPVEASTVEVTNGVLTINNSKITAPVDYAITVSGGEAKIMNCVVTVNANKSAVVLGPAGSATLINTTLTVGSLSTNSVTGSSGAQIKVLNAWANKPVQDAVTQLVGIVIINSEVV